MIFLREKVFSLTLKTDIENTSTSKKFGILFDKFVYLIKEDGSVEARVLNDLFVSITREPNLNLYKALILRKFKE